MKEIIQITEEQAKKMLKSIWPMESNLLYNQVFYVKIQEDYLNFWKENGFIKKSALKEARAFCQDIRLGGFPPEPYYQGYKSGVAECAEKFEAAIAELQEKV